MVYRLNELRIASIEPDNGVSNATALILASSDNITPTTVMLYDGAEVNAAYQDAGQIQGEIPDTGDVGVHTVTLSDPETGQQSAPVPFTVTLT
jgi:hypothetical protein